MLIKKREIVLVLFLFCVGLFLIYPYAYMIHNSFLPWNIVDKKVFSFDFSLRSYQWLLFQNATAPWIKALINSLFVSTVNTFLVMSFAILAAYAMAKMSNKLTKNLELFLLFQMFFPAIILFIPNFLIVSFLDINRNYAGMILPKMISPWVIFVLLNFFRSVEDSYLESARLDGAKIPSLIYYIMLPMAKSVLIILTLFTYLDRWGELMWDMIIVSGNRSLVTLAVLIANMFKPYDAYPGGLYAAAVIMTLPMLLLFFIFSRHFKDGMSFLLK